MPSHLPDRQPAACDAAARIRAGSHTALNALVPIRTLLENFEDVMSSRNDWADALLTVAIDESIERLCAATALVGCNAPPELLVDPVMGELFDTVARESAVIAEQLPSLRVAISGTGPTTRPDSSPGSGPDTGGTTRGRLA